MRAEIQKASCQLAREFVPPLTRWPVVCGARKPVKLAHVLENPMMTEEKRGAKSSMLMVLKKSRMGNSLFVLKVCSYACVLSKCALVFHRIMTCMLASKLFLMCQISALTWSCTPAR